MTQPSDSTRKMRYSLVNRDDALDAGGRREYFDYRDLALSAASNGFMRAQLICNKKGKTPPTGWHYHTCEAQIVYFLRGWADLEFEDGKRVRTRPGDMLFIPGGVLHNEGESSDDIEVIEMSIPAEMGTVNVDPPEGFTQVFGERTKQMAD